jgi:hypothetical protein
MVQIQSLRPNVTQDEAIEMFRSGPSGWVRRALRGPLLRVAELYIPFCPFEAEWTSGASIKRMRVGLDAAWATLDLYLFEPETILTQTISLATRNVVPAVVGKEALQSAVRDKIRRMLFSQGFFRLRNLAITVRPLGTPVCVPYWLGFYARGPEVRVVVLDAVRRCLEGAKARTLVTAWLGSQGPEAKVLS